MAGGGSSAPPVATCIADPYYNGPTGDPYFANVVLLHLSGADGETAIADTGPNTLPFTRVGTPTISSGQQLFGGNSLYLSTTTQGYTSPANAAFQFGTGDFTVEFWVYMTATSSGDFLQFGARDATGSNRWAVNMQPNNVCGFLVDSTNFCNTNTGAIGTGAWKHVAFVRSGTTLRSFVNGADQGNNGTVSTNFNNASTFRIGDEPAFSGFATTYLREIRITKGIARYTGNFVIPTAAFPDGVPVGHTGADSYFQDTVLWFQAEDYTGQGRFLDSSSYGNVITNTGTPTASQLDYAFRRQGASSHYGVNIGLQVPDGAHLRMDISDFYARAWVYVTGYALTNSPAVVFGQENATTATGRWMLTIQSPPSANANKLAFYYQGSTILFSTNTVPLNQWVELAVSVSSGTIRIFIDGTLEGSVARPGSFSAAIGWRFRGSGSGATSFSGWMDDFRVIKGQAVHTASYTPATPATWGLEEHTVLSLHGEAIVDSSSEPKTLTNNGATVSSAESQFGTSALSFVGASSQYLACGGYSDYTMTGDFTFEFWAKEVNGNNCWWSTATANTPYFYNGNVYNILGTGVNLSYGSATISVWTQFLIVRSGTTVYVFRNGVLISSGTYAGTLDFSGLELGRYKPSTNLYLTGYIDDIRITRGVARETSAFTPPALTFCDSTTASYAGQVDGTEYPDGQQLTMSQGTLRVANPWVKLSGQALIASAGTAIATLPNKTAALLGQSATVSQGTTVTPDRTVALTGATVTAQRGNVAVAQYPSLINTTVGPITQTVNELSGSVCTLTLFSDGTFTVLGILDAPLGSGTWIDTSNASFDISTIAVDYQFERFIPMSIQLVIRPPTYSTPPQTLDAQVVIQDDPSDRAPQNCSFVVVVGPAPTNPRYGEAGYKAQITVLLTNVFP